MSSRRRIIKSHSFAFGPRTPAHALRAFASIFAVAVAAFGAAGCSDAARKLGTPAAARHKSGELLAAVAHRLGETQRDADMEATRARLIRHWFLPSRVYRDTGMWSQHDDSSRTFTFYGFPPSVGDRQQPYRLVMRSEIPAPLRGVATTRGIHTLAKVGDNNVYRWTSRDELAIGSIAPTEVQSVITSLLTDAAPPAPVSLADAAGELERNIRQHFPSSTAALGRMYSLDSLSSARHADGSHTFRFSVRLHVDTAHGFSTQLAQYYRKHVDPIRMHTELLGPDDRLWGEFTFEQGIAHGLLRLRDGALIPIEGLLAPRASLPADSLRLRMSFHTRAGLFGIGVSELHGTIRSIREESSFGYGFTFQKEPRWHLPLAMRHLIPAPLRRPFEGEGAYIEFVTSRVTPDAPTVLARRTRIDVEESAILRFLGGIGQTAMEDYKREIERERDRYMASIYWAIQDDILALLSQG